MSGAAHTDPEGADETGNGATDGLLAAIDPAGDAASPWRARVVQRSLDEAARRSIDRSAAFVGATIELLEERGNSFTIQDVCDRAGFSMRLFYQYFDGKADLLSAVFEEALLTAVEEVRGLLAGIDDPIERLAGYILRSVSITLTPYRSALLRYSAQLQSSNARGFDQALQPHVEFLKECIDAAVDAGGLPPGDTDERAYFVLAVRTAYNHSSLLGNETSVDMPPPEELARFLIRALGGAWTPTVTRS